MSTSSFFFPITPGADFSADYQAIVIRTGRMVALSGEDSAWGHFMPIGRTVELEGD